MLMRRSRARVRALWLELSANLRGALWILLAALLLTAMGALVKHLGRDIPPVQMVFFRSLVSVAVVMPIMLRGGVSAFYTKRPGWHLLRTLVGTTGMFCVFYAFSHLPLAETVAIVFSRPLFAVWLAMIFLGEAVGWRRISAAIVGFLGVLVMVRPGTAAFDPASLVAVLAAITAGSIAVIIKKMSTTEATSTIILWFSVGSAVITAVPALIEWVPPTPLQWVYLAAIGALGIAGMAALTKGFSTGDTSFVTPFDYSRLIYATAIGFLLFGETPDVWTIVGAAIIVASGYYIARRELAANRRHMRERRSRRPEPAARPGGGP
jgi:drug/metabolite transporter (DMT)-like permease